MHHFAIGPTSTSRRSNAELTAPAVLMEPTVLAAAAPTALVA
jgi:hypothetical protein